METKTPKNPPKSKSSETAATSTKPKVKKSFRITKELVFYTLFIALWAVLATIASQFIVANILVIFIGDQISQPGWMLVYYVLVYAISLSLVLLVPPRLAKLYRERKETPKISQELEHNLATTPTELGMQHAPTFVDIGLAPIGYIVYTFIATIITNIMSNFSWFNPEESQDVGFGYFVTNIDRIFAMLAVVFIAPIAEEIIMRGWLYGKIRRKWPVVPAIIIVSLVFAALHGQWNVAVSTFVLSCVLCALREITGTIWSGMLLHILSNGIAFYILYVAV